MAAALNATTVAGILKRYFANKTVQNSIAAKQGAIWKAMPKKTDGGGDFCSFTQVIKDVFTVSQDFVVAQGLAQNSTVSPGLKFNMPWQEINAPIRVSAKAKALTRTNTTAFLNAVAFASASAMRMAHHMLSVRALASGWGELAATGITYTPGTNNFTVANGAINHFVEGMPLVASLTLHADALKSATAALVTNVDYGTNKVTTSVASLSGTLGWANADFVFLNGDRDNTGGGAAVRKCAVGLRTWLPEVRPVVDTGITIVEGTDRTGNSRAFGMYVDGTAKDDLDACEELVAQCVVLGNATDLTMNVSHRRWVEMAKTLSSDRRFSSADTGEGGFLKLTVNAMEMKVKVVVDRNCEDDVGYALQAQSFANVGAGETPHIQMDGDGQWVRVSDDNSSELRIYGVHAFVMYDPAACGVVKFAIIT
jgi:hypothetical protein